MWLRFWFRRGIGRIGRWRFFRCLLKRRRKLHQTWSTLPWCDRQCSSLRYFCVKSFHVLRTDELMETYKVKWKEEFDSQILTLQKLWTGYLLQYGPQFDIVPTRFLRQGLRGAHAKVRTAKDLLKTWHCNFLKKITIISFFNCPFLPPNHFMKIYESYNPISHAKLLQPTKINKIPR